jgi:hypothetical protein
MMLVVSSLYFSIKDDNLEHKLASHLVRAPISDQEEMCLNTLRGYILVHRLNVGRPLGTGLYTK